MDLDRSRRGSVFPPLLSCSVRACPYVIVYVVGRVCVAVHAAISSATVYTRRTKADSRLLLRSIPAGKDNDIVSSVGAHVGGLLNELD
jgi:hypothetical protein